MFSISAREDGGEENAMGWMGLLLRKGRLEKDWSQEGLCKGICAVSYLSKIEQGKGRFLSGNYEAAVCAVGACLAGGRRSPADGGMD